MIQIEWKSGNKIIFTQKLNENKMHIDKPLQCTVYQIDVANIDR